MDPAFSMFCLIQTDWPSLIIPPLWRKHPLILGFASEEKTWCKVHCICFYEVPQPLIVFRPSVIEPSILATYSSWLVNKIGRDLTQQHFNSLTLISSEKPCPLVYDSANVNQALPGYNWRFPRYAIA